MPSTAPPKLPQARTRDLRTKPALLSAMVLAAYPLAIGYLSSGAGSDASEGAALTADPFGLLASAGFELLVFSVVLALACFPHRALLGAGFFRGFKPSSIGRGFAYSILLRIAIGIATLAVVAGLSAATGASTEELGAAAQPDVGALVDIDSLAENPLYLALNLTLVSFVLGGLREELWRAALFHCLITRFPGLDRSSGGHAILAASVAVVFGLGHLGQGFSAVLLTGALGFGLGWILLRAQSAWEAVFAHGFFNATSFAALMALQRYAPEILQR